MPPFHFRLQPVLERAHVREAAARAALVDARVVCDEATVLLAAVETRLADVRAAGALGREAGAWAANEAAGIALAALCERRARRAHEAAALVARGRDAYAKLAAERRALEALRERRLADYRRLAELAEFAQIDEQNCRRSNEGGPSAVRRLVS